ncbi:hypothetical protein [Pseudarthrobacter sulfonivorans]|jgi:threonine dehydrogenase-like Zn-dependent dehydrogenase|uniref:hypothetical protein n=1 Tax=Pseudarthrobacter sulfonivorans TaxID=121292 RepID=UPI00286632F4|nr:hypothetical protein [Pseudarthrobacter sulfonivorans]MDR6417506.1 threonine dehydrogenase-like Zn-dependent dehydrogenase [Pseudarthrobacter sulfonivorans]
MRAVIYKGIGEIVVGESLRSRDRPEGRSGQQHAGRQFVLSELTMIGSTAYNNEDIAQVVSSLGDEKYDPPPVLTHHFAQEDVVEAFKTAIEKKDEAIKIVVDVYL